MASVKRSILDTIEEKGKTELLVNFTPAQNPIAIGDHQSDQDFSKKTLLPTANKFHTVGIKGLVSW
jgi:hypothetical protein